MLVHFLKSLRTYWYLFSTINFLFFLQNFSFFILVLIVDLLGFFFLKNKFQNFIKNGGLVDFLLKYFSKLYIYNALINLSFFFAEKYMIEFTTRYLYNWLILVYMNIFKFMVWSNMYVYLVLTCLNIFFILF